MDYVEVVQELEARKPERLKPSLDRIRALSDLLDHPELKYRTIHITGTNGKGTTARLAARILCGQGVTSGLYTSPHLYSVRERLALCDVPIPQQELVATYEHLRPYLEVVDGSGDPLTYFETLTGLAFLWMADKPVDVGVYEVGMGGTWDATNLVRSDVAVFTEIGLDHPELGATPEEVAGEKAGIAKLGSTIIIREQSPEVTAVIRARADDLGCPVMLEGPHFRLTSRELAVGGQRLAIETPRTTYEDLYLPLHGEHQAHNLALAVAASETIVEDELHADALRETLTGATAPGRLEVARSEPTVLLDGAHNAAGAAAIARA
ncbi:MAG TPA: Mur ligase family protein, partial [Actinomycetota bacterium]|nr:Mur ligase family protein [Actinomycetota bacterium]